MDCGAEDGLSLLPNDILVSILCRLTLKEAVSTSCLSRRWRYLWTLISSLDFDADDKLNKIAAEPKSKSCERSKYINWVNRVVRKYGGLTLDTSKTLDAFRICFDLDKGSKAAVDNWVKFAVAKRTQKLELDLLENGETLRQPQRNYTFPYKLLSQSRGSSSRQSYSNIPRMPLGTNMGLKALKVLSLKCVNVNDEALQYFLFNCPLLQCLSIHGSGDLVNVKVTGKSLALKSFEIVFCLGIKSIEIYDTNLVSFSYLGAKINLLINNVPRLDEVSIGQGYSGLENKVIGQLSSCLYQLEILTLDIYRPEVSKNSSLTVAFLFSVV